MEMGVDAGSSLWGRSYRQSALRPPCRGRGRSRGIIVVGGPVEGEEDQL